MSGKRVLRALRKAGFHLHHITGSHPVMEKMEPKRIAIVGPAHGNRDLSTGTLRAILDQAGLTVEEFTALL